jgi:hypothetical protein
MNNKETLGDFIKRESKSANESVGIVKGYEWQQEQDKNKYSDEEVEILINALNKISQFSDIGNDFLAIIKMKSIATDVVKQIKKK